MDLEVILFSFVYVSGGVGSQPRSLRDRSCLFGLSGENRSFPPRNALTINDSSHYLLNGKIAETALMSIPRILLICLLPELYS